MAFPNNLTVIDNFNRTENPVSDGGKWTCPLNTGNGSLETVVGAYLQSTGGDCDGYRNDQDYGPDCEIYATLQTVDVTNGHEWALFARIAATGSIDGYKLSITTSTGPIFTWELRVVTDSSDAALGASFTQPLSNADAVGLQIIGDTLYAWHKPAAGSWTNLTSRVDGSNTYPSAGKFGVYIGGADWQLDSLNGGTIEAGTPNLIQSHFRFRNDDGGLGSP